MGRETTNRFRSNATFVGYIIHVILLQPFFLHLREVTCSVKEYRFWIYRFWAVLDVGHTLIWRALSEFDFPGRDSHDILIWRFPKSWGYPCSSSIYIHFILGFSIINYPAIGVPPFHPNNPIPLKFPQMLRSMCKFPTSTMLSKGLFNIRGKASSLATQLCPTGGFLLKWGYPKISKMDGL